MPRNVLVLLCDQLRADFLGPYGCRAIDTPGIDWLAAHGVTFERALTQAPICGPARATLATGRLVSDHGAFTNDVPTRPGLETIGALMRDAGYRTGCFGKMHHVPANEAPGFETAVLFEEGRLGEAEPYVAWLRAQHPELADLLVRGPFAFQHGDHPRSLLPEEAHYETWIASRAIDFLDQGDGRPFLAWVSFQGPHSPYDPVDGMGARVDEAGLPAPVAPGAPSDSPYARARDAWRQVPRGGAGLARYRRAYAEMIAQIDGQIARILRHLDEHGLLEDTTIVFTADHGDELGDHGVDKKGPLPYAGSLRVPLIVANDPRVGRGLVTDALAGNIDVGATLLDVAGSDVPFGASRSLIDLAQPAPEHPRGYVFSEYLDHMKVVESRTHRLAYFPFLGRAELFDLERDPEALENLSGRPELAAVELDLMRRMVDFGAVCNGPRVAANELFPEVQVGLRALLPRFEETLPIAFPLNARQQKLLRERGLPADYNEYCRGRDTLVDAGVYWGRPAAAKDRVRG